jgi:hypothetical protein
MIAIQETNVSIPTGFDNPDSIESFTHKFNQARSAAASTFLELARVVHQAYETLDKVSFKTFVAQASVGSASTVKKFLAMGQRYDLLQSHIEKLPSNWTTVYQLSRVDESNLGELLESGSIHPQLKAKELKQLVTPDEPAVDVLSQPQSQEQTQSQELLQQQSQPPTKKAVRLLSISLPESFDEAEEQEFKDALDRLKRIGCQITIRT